MRKANRDLFAAEITCDVTDAHLRARVVQQRVMWVFALFALIAAGVLAAFVVAGRDQWRATEPDAPGPDGFHQIWSVSSVARR